VNLSVLDTPMSTRTASAHALSGQYNSAVAPVVASVVLTFTHLARASERPLRSSFPSNCFRDDDALTALDRAPERAITDEPASVAALAWSQEQAKHAYGARTARGASNE